MMGTAFIPRARYATHVVPAADAHPNTITAAVRRTDFHGLTTGMPILLSGVIRLLRMPPAIMLPVIPTAVCPLRCTWPLARYRPSGSRSDLGRVARVPDKHFAKG
ncbi:hypothetical protein GCM10010094_70990 [Streptomyces flaveus]|uniref:Uncharacterized protein n=1 Tax=Streptomyces flaveus TaxID=66370 RepID=A0A917VMV3_9ACTN|nr:hypothetical protein GCM10010094_70990 [Streptomyces flaveus]